MQRVDQSEFVTINAKNHMSGLWIYAELCEPL